VQHQRQGQGQGQGQRQVTKPMVIIASVPWRGSNARKLFDAVIDQGYPLYILLDGYSEEAANKIRDEYCVPGNVVEVTEERGHVARWRIAAQHDRFALIDDDLEILPGYLDNGFAALERTGADIVAWGGFIKNGRRKSILNEVAEDSVYDMFYASTPFGKGKAIRAFWGSEYGTPDMVETFMKLIDDGLVSAYCRAAHKSMICPKGPSFVLEVGALAKDPRRLYYKARDHARELNERLESMNHASNA
jgi:hypothetical protein